LVESSANVWPTCGLVLALPPGRAFLPSFCRAGPG